MPTKGPRPNILKKARGYRDVFEPDNRRKMPLILVDCTSVSWPAGWSKEDIARWRQSNNLTKPM